MALKNLKILVVDDHMIMRRMVEKNLDAMGLGSVDTSADGEEALGKIKAGSFDIILADWNMPKLSGEQLLAEIRSDNKYDNMAFVMVTAESENENILKIMNAGATAYIVKPFSDTEFQETMGKVLSWVEERYA